ncbi:MAG: DUF4350 domain-containing protein [Polyangiaceae bacterium]|nr:DUF4350 domain-containing protein [Polyangiaceae bacterium]
MGPDRPQRAFGLGRFGGKLGFVKGARKFWTSWVVVALGLGFSSVAHADFDFNEAGWQGTSEFLAEARKALGTKRVRILATLDFGALQPADGLLLLHPNTDLSYEQLSRFMSAGGRVAILDDFGSGARLLKRFQITRINAPSDPVEMLRNNPELAIAVPAFQSSKNHVGRHPTANNVDRLVTNHPSVFLHEHLTPILSIRTKAGEEAALAVTGVIGDQGRLLAMGDPSAFINLMLRYPGNRQFAKGLVQYLVGPDSWGERGGNLYLLANKFEQTGSFGQSPTLLERVRESMSSLLGELTRTREQGLPDVVAYILSAACALGALAWALLRATKPYRRLTPRYALPAPLVGQGGAAGRAAVLGARSTHRALTLVELKGAVTEGFVERLHLDHHAAPNQILHEAEKQGVLDRAALAELKDLIGELEAAENGLASKKPHQVRDRQVDQLRKRALKLLKAL